MTSTLRNYIWSGLMALLETMHNRIDLEHVPFTDRGSRLMLFRRADNKTLYIRLAERWEKWQSELGHYRQRAPVVREFVFLDADGQPLAFEVETEPHVVHLNTASGTFSWTFPDAETLLVKLPPGAHGFDFTAYGESGQIERRGGVLRGKRNLAYTTNARITANEISLVDDKSYHVRVMLEAGDSAALLLNITPRLGFNHSVPKPDVEIALAQERWQAWYDKAPDVLPEYRAQYDYAWWVMRAGLLSQRFYFTREALSPSKIHYVGVWQWDQFFHAIAYRHVDTRLAEDQIRIVIDHQRPDGMLPDAIHDEGLVTRLNYPVEEDVTKPPLLAWTVLKLFEVSGHHDFIEEVYEPVARWQNWWMTHSSNGRGLAEYRHPFSSGLDDSPLWDYGMPVTSPDLNTYLVIQRESLATMADQIGRPHDAAQYRAEADDLARAMIDQLWDEQRGMFMAVHQGEFVPVVTPFSLLPLWTNRLPEHIVHRLLTHLTDPTLFWTEWPLATVAANDPAFDPMQMWRGPTWVNINYLFVEALTRIGQHDLARKLRRRTLDLIMQHNDIYEYYNPLTAERPPKAAPIFGWTSAVFIDLAIQETVLEAEAKSTFG
ncbi:MAG: trehalase family glycosidase [bacterium]|nr:trehalase family glycosidase [bacterium]